MIIRSLVHEHHLIMVLDAIVLDGARTSHEVALITGLRRPVIWAAVAALSETGLVRTSMLRSGDVHATPNGVAAVRDHLAELNRRWLADADALPELA